MRWITGAKLSGAVLARTLDKKINLFRFVALWKFYCRNLDVEAIRLAAFRALEVHMLMAMFGGRTRTGTERIFKAAAIIQHLMYETAVIKRFERAINGHAVNVVRDLAFNITVR